MAFNLVNPEVGFTSDVIKDPNRFVGRSILIRDSIAALNSSLGLIAIYGRRGVGKSSLTRQIQALANGNYELFRRAGLFHLLPEKPRKYYTVYYQCNSMISNAADLLARLCNDTNAEDGLLRLVPDKVKRWLSSQEQMRIFSVRILKSSIGVTRAKILPSTQMRLLAIWSKHLGILQIPSWITIILCSLSVMVY